MPHNFNPTDALTKIKVAHLQPCLDLLSFGMYHLRTESANWLTEQQRRRRPVRKLEIEISINLPINCRSVNTSPKGENGVLISSGSFSSFFRPLRTQWTPVNTARPVGVFPNALSRYVSRPLPMFRKTPNSFSTSLQTKER